VEKRNREHADLSAFADGRDESNLAEFPIAVLGDAVPVGLKSIEFEDELRDWSTGKPIQRKVCVTGSDRFGLPTAKDEDVLLALIQLTKIANNFTSPEVWFNKHQVIEILGWKNRGWAYDRVEEALHRWRGVSIHYWNAWRDNARKRWCDSAAIGVIEYFAISDGRRDHSPNVLAGQSRFAWNKVFFESFQAGYLKALDFDMYRQLKRPAARRAFRFLDKRFWHEPNWVFDLREFACEKLGFSRTYSTGQLKERLTPALVELEAIGFIEPVCYRKVKPKYWTVSVAKKNKQTRREVGSDQTPTSVVDELVKNGVDATVANELVAEFTPERITEKLRFVAWLTARRDKRSPKNPAGFLVSAIRDNYLLPPDYRKQLGQTTKPIRRRGPTVTKSKPASDVESGRVNSHLPESEVRAYLDSLGTADIEAIEEKALRAASATEVASYERLRATNSELFATLRDSLLRKFLLANDLQRVAAADAV
jgi:hypothetical protein